MSKLFFRVEAKNQKSDESKVFNKGYYRVTDGQGKFVFGLVGLDTNNDNRHPLPDEDTKLKSYWESLSYDVQWEHFFGFSSFEQLKRWFYRDEWLSELDEYLKITVYKVENLHEGYTQAVCKDEDVITKVIEFPVTVTESEVMDKLKQVL